MILQNLAVNLMININCKLVLMILNVFLKDFFFMKEMFELFSFVYLSTVKNGEFDVE